DPRIRRHLRHDFDDLEEYEPVKPFDVLAAEIGMAPEALVKLDANENLYGPIPEIVEAIAHADLHIYPDPSQTALPDASRGYAGVEANQVVAGSGADDLIDVLLRLAMPRSVVNLPPTFGMYSFLAKINRSRIVEVPRLIGFVPDIPAIDHAVNQGAGMVFLT